MEELEREIFDLVSDTVGSLVIVQRRVLNANPCDARHWAESARDSANELVKKTRLYCDELRKRG